MQYNISMQNMSMIPGLDIEYTYGDILQQFTDAFITQTLTINLIIFAYTTYVLYYVTGWETPSYFDIIKGGDKITKKAVKAKILHEGAFICWMLSLYYPLIIIGHLSGW